MLPNAVVVEAHSNEPRLIDSTAMSQVTWSQRYARGTIAFFGLSGITALM